MRLLDFTRRLAVAVHFATQERRDAPPSIWAIDGYRLEIAWRQRLVGPTETLRINSPFANWREFNALYPTRDLGFAAMLVEPRAPNRRQELQGGLYLAGINMTHSLEENLFGAFGHKPASIIPEPNSERVLTSPMGVNVKPLQGGGRRRIVDAGVVQVELRIPEAEVQAFLTAEDVSDKTLGLEDPP